MTLAEQALVFAFGEDELVGVLHAPPRPRQPAVVIVVGGPQYRAGSHRQFVLLARRLAENGFPVLRFDHRGMGDSPGGQRSFEMLSDDIGCAIDELQRRTGASKVVLWGLCDGASAALLYCLDKQDKRLVGLCLVNPWMRSDTSLARTHVKHYYVQRLLQREFWLKLLHGQVGAGALAGLWRNVRVALSGSRPTTVPQNLPFQHRMARAWHGFRHGILLMLSEEDYTAKEFVDHANAEAAWAGAMRHPHLLIHKLPGADHTFSRKVDRVRAEDLTLAWLETL